MREPPSTLTNDADADISNPPDSLVRHIKPERPKVFVFSAHDEAGLKRMISEYTNCFQSGRADMGKEGFLANLAYTLAVRRTPLRWRSFLLTNSPQDFIKLDSKMSLPIPAINNATLGFVFTGQGAQWAGMGHGLSSFKVFRQSLQDAEDYLRNLGCHWLLCGKLLASMRRFYLQDLDELFKVSKRSSINKPEFSQPLCTAIQVALVDLLHSFGVQPAAVVGHSSGEIAAA